MHASRRPASSNTALNSPKSTSREPSCSRNLMRAGCCPPCSCQQGRSINTVQHYNTSLGEKTSWWDIFPSLSLPVLFSTVSLTLEDNDRSGVNGSTVLKVKALQAEDIDISVTYYHFLHELPLVLKRATSRTFLSFSHFILSASFFSCLLILFS